MKTELTTLDDNNNTISMDSNAIIRQWLDDLAFSAATWNLEAHMDLVSKDVVVFGIPGIGKINYLGWENRRRNEFNKKLLHSLNHKDPKILSERPKIITFSVQELMRDKSRQSIELDKEITLHQEEDGKWRVIREVILNITATQHCAVP